MKVFDPLRTYRSPSRRAVVTRLNASEPEPGSGSDAFSLVTTARRDGDRYVLNGSKTFITNAPIADLFLVFATVDRSMGWAGLCAFLVQRDSPGLTIAQPLHKMG